MNQTPQVSSAQHNRKPKLRWFQFGLRTLGIVMTALCVGLAWLIHDVREQEAVVKMIEEHGGTVTFGEPSFLGRWSFVRSLFGKHAFAPIDVVWFFDGTTDAHLLPLKKLKKIRYLTIRGKQVTDLSPLAGLTELRYLNVWDTSVTDLSPLAGLDRLTELYLECTKVSD